MSKAVLISIRPEWCEKIVSGRKTLELRKSRPASETPFKCYFYCTSVKRTPLEEYCRIYARTGGFIDDWQGKVIGEFTCDHIMRQCDMQNADLAEQQSLVKRKKIFEYANGKEVYGWHISELKIYDKPKALSEFEGLQKTRFGYAPYKITRPPQSWCYVEELS